MEERRVGVCVSRLSFLCVATVLTIGFSQPADAGNVVPAPSGMITWWTFDETTGTNAADIIGGNDGTHINGPVPVAGMVGNALRFDGRNDYVRVPDSDLWHFGSGGFTIELWASFDPGSPGSIGRPGDVLIGNDQGGGERPKWFFAWGAYRLNFHVNNYGSNPRFFLPRVPFYPSSNQWYHLAVTRAGDTIAIFVDGVAQSPTATRAFVIPNANAPLTIGQAEGLGYMNGCIDEMTIYDRALSEQELRGIYMAGSAGKSTTQSQPPVVNAGGSRICRAGVQVLLTAAFVGNPSDTHTAWWDFDGDGTTDQSGIVVEGNGSGDVYGTHVSTQPGKYTAEVCVQNDKGQYACDNVVITVQANQLPIADAGPDQTVHAGTQVTLDGSGSYDPDGDPLTYTWYLNGQVIATGVNTTIQLPAGVHVVDLIVNDGIEDSQPDQVVLTVIQTVSIDIYPNRLPNRVFLSRNCTLYVATLGSADFDVTTLDSAAIKFGRTGTEASPVRAPIMRDLNGDGFVDAMYGFQTADCGFQLGDTEGWLIGFTINGAPVEGVDSVLVSP